MNERPNRAAQKFITNDVQNTEGFQMSMEKLRRAVEKASALMGRTSIPFWSPRYEAHMYVLAHHRALRGLRTNGF